MICVAFAHLITISSKPEGVKGWVVGFVGCGHLESFLLVRVFFSIFYWSVFFLSIFYWSVFFQYFLLVRVFFSICYWSVFFSVFFIGLYFYWSVFLKLIFIDLYFLLLFISYWSFFYWTISYIFCWSKFLLVHLNLGSASHSAEYFTVLWWWPF